MEARVCRAEEVDWIEAPGHFSAFSKLLVNESHGKTEATMSKENPQACPGESRG